MSSQEKNVIEWIKKTQQVGDRLPSLREMAQFCGTSIATVQKAVDILKSQNYLIAKPRAGLWIQSSTSQNNFTSVQFGRSWGQVQKRFLNALHLGELAQGPRLPRAKELAQFLKNCSQPTLRKVLADLENKGIVCREGGGWRVAGQAGLRTLRCVVLVAAYVQGRVRMETSREIEFFRCIEEECHTRGLTLKIVGYEESTETFLPGEPDEAFEFVGVIFSPWHMIHAGACLQRVAQWKCPVSIWVEAPQKLEWVGQYAKRKDFALFSVGYGKEPGQSVGRYLQDRGHRRAAYISPFHESTWSQDRLSGLQNVLENTVHACVDERYSNTWSFRDKIENSAFGKMTIKKLLPPLLRNDVSAGSQLVLGQWHEQVYELARDLQILKILKPLVQDALEQNACTAWVFANDLCATLTIGLLEDLQVPMQQWPCMVSFDNSPESIVYGVDSYEFNTRGMVQSMVHHVLAPKNPLYNGQKIIHPRGHVVSRRL